MNFCKCDILNEVVRPKLTGPWEGGGSGGKFFFKQMIGYCMFESANEIIENLLQNHN